MDEERILNFRGKNFKHEVRFVNTTNNSTNKQNTSKTRCKYCYKAGHTDETCRDKAQKRPHSMPD